MDAFAALADPLRRDVVRRLAAGPARVVDLAEGLPVSRPAVSRHLRLLLEAGVVAVEDRGRERLYSLTQPGLEPIRTCLADLDGPPMVGATALDALDLEVRRTVRDRGASDAGADPRETEETA